MGRTSQRPGAHLARPRPGCSQGAGGAGNFDLDFSGDWQESARASIDAGLSNLTLTVPREIGVRIETGDQALANVNARGFRREGTAWVNDAYGESEIGRAHV